MAPPALTRPLESHPKMLVATLAAWVLLWAVVLGGLGSGWTQRLLQISDADKLGHTVLYGGITAILVFLVGDRRLPILGWVSINATFVFGLSVVEEFRQRSIPARNFDLGDIVANGLGVTLGWTVAYVLLSVWTAQRTGGSDPGA